MCFDILWSVEEVTNYEMKNESVERRQWVEKGVVFEWWENGKKRWFAPNCGPLGGLSWKKACANYLSWGDENWAYDKGVSKGHLRGQKGFLFFDDFSKIGLLVPFETSGYKHKHCWYCGSIQLEWLKLAPGLLTRFCTFSPILSRSPGALSQYSTYRMVTRQRPQPVAWRFSRQTPSEKMFWLFLFMGNND